MKKDINIKLIITTLLLNAIFFVILVFGLGNTFSKTHSDWFLFSKTSPRNLNQENWVNHHYPYNMLNTAEPNSIFMTEGGDNQVFSILYFALVENKRPDIDFFDQKGNVFPRLYGDFFKTGRSDVVMIRELRDFQLFSTDRPIYLTWQRPGLENLTVSGIQNIKQRVLNQLSPQERPAFNARYKLNTVDQMRRTTHTMVSSSIYDMALRSGGNLKDQDFKYLGPWYLKPLGLLFRVTPIRYALVDALETLNGTGAHFTIRRQIEANTRVMIDDVLYERMTAALEAEGYVTRKGLDTLTLLKPFRPLGELEDKDYWDNYTINYTNVSNAAYWERLARDIYASYTQLKRESHLRYSRVYQTKASLGQENSTGEIDNIDYFKKANEEREAIDAIMLETAPYVYDNNSFMYDTANLLSNKNKRLEAVDYYERAANNYYPLVEPSFVAATILLDRAYQNWEEREPLIERALSNIENARAARKLYFQLKEPEKNIERDGVLLRASALKNQADFLMEVSPAQLNEQKTKAIGEKKRGDVRKLARRYLQLNRTNDVITLYETLIRENPTNVEWYLDFISTIGPHNRGVALSVISRIEEAYGDLDAPPKLWEFEYTRGILTFRDTLERYRQGTPPDQLTNSFIESQERLERYIESAEHLKEEPTFRKRIIQAEKTVQYIKDFLVGVSQAN